MKYLLLVLLLTFCSCDDPPSLYPCWVCTCQESQKVSEFITDNVKAANNMSDEEMEDVIAELRRTGVMTLCHQELLWKYSGSKKIDWSKSKLDSCETFHGY